MSLLQQPPPIRKSFIAKRRRKKKRSLAYVGYLLRMTHPGDHGGAVNKPTYYLSRILELPGGEEKNPPPLYLVAAVGPSSLIKLYQQGQGGEGGGGANFSSDIR